jgi:DNA-binding transcriptional LysR family regulator
MTANSSAPPSLPASVSTQAPYWLFVADIRAGTVRRILRDREPARIPINAVRPASRRQPSKVAVFVDFLAELLVDEEA